jgi:hypothetical protein
MTKKNRQRKRLLKIGAGVAGAGVLVVGRAALANKNSRLILKRTRGLTNAAGRGLVKDAALSVAQNAKTLIKNPKKGLKRVKKSIRNRQRLRTLNNNNSVLTNSYTNPKINPNAKKAKHFFDDTNKIYKTSIDPKKSRKDREGAREELRDRLDVLKSSGVYSRSKDMLALFNSPSSKPKNKRRNRRLKNIAKVAGAIGAGGLVTTGLVLGGKKLMSKSKT